MDWQRGFVRGTLTGAAVLSALVLMGLVAAGRGEWAVAYAVGGAISAGNFWLIAQAVQGATQGGSREGAGRLWKGAAFRFVGVAAVLVTALVIFRLHLLALAAGLLVTQVWMLLHWLVQAVREAA